MSIKLRIALFNIQDLSTAKLMEDGESSGAGGEGGNAQLRAAAQIVQRVRPDVLVINEIDHDIRASAGDEPNEAPLDRNLLRFARRYLEQGPEAIELPHAFAAPCNTGYLSGFDLNGTGRAATVADLGTHEYALDCWGYGHYPGHYAMGVLSRVPIDRAATRTFQNLRWLDLPGHHLAPGFLPAEAEERIPLSSKSHWDVALTIGDRPLQLLMCHPTPRGYDGRGSRNWARNFDELAFWVRYLDGAAELRDDAGRRGGIASNETPFVLAGDFNAEPLDSPEDFDGTTAIGQLLRHALIRDTGPLLTSSGALQGRRPGATDYPEGHTIQYRDGMTARLDYLLPHRALRVNAGGVFWPDPHEDPEGHALATVASDHRLVWLDLELP